MSRRFSVVFQGSNHVAADQFEVHVDDVLSETQLAELHVQCFQCFSVKLPKEAFSANTVDCATKAAYLQNTLLQFFKDCSWHGEVRAFAGQHELTLKPHQWSEYFSAYIDNDRHRTAKPAKPIDGLLVKAWNYLKNTDNVRIAVTTYSKYESIIGHLRTAAVTNPTGILDVWNRLSDKEKTLRVVVQFIKIGRYNFLCWDAAREAYSIINRHFGAEKIAECNAFLSELLAKSGCWYLSVCPPRVLGNVFSDMIYQELSHGTYTRNDVLERAKVCGDILGLHGGWYLDDLEVMEAALESSYLHRLPVIGWCTHHRSVWFKKLMNDKQFMIKAILKNKRNSEALEFSSLANDPDVYAAEQTEECKQALRKVLCTNHSVDGPQSEFEDHLSPTTKFHPNPVEAAYILAYCPFNTNIDSKVSIDKDTMLDIVSRDASVLERIVRSAAQKLVKQNAGLETAAHELVSDQQFMLDCVRKNRYIVFQVVEAFPGLYIEAQAAAFASFGPAKWAALHAELYIDAVYIDAVD
jgi:hypothetical protein